MAFSTSKDRFYQCTACGKEYSQWQGQCHSCSSWNTIVEKEPIPASTVNTHKKHQASHKVSPLSLVDIPTQIQSRIKLPGSELNRVLGGGIMPGSIVLISGEPGIGKSSLLLRLASDICDIQEKKVLYVSGEESEEQVKQRCDRFQILKKSLFLLHETSLNSIIQFISDHVFAFVPP